MSALEMSARIGQSAVWRSDDLVFEVQIVDANRSYGHVRYLITPAAGSGMRWVNGEKLRFVTESEEINA